ncbi:DUF3131 domain-containing protein [bacterium]|nr:DUF3131 domain-containing protein [bacterium]
MTKTLTFIKILYIVIVGLLTACAVSPTKQEKVLKRDILQSTADIQHITTRDSLYLKTLARDTWNFFSRFVDSETGLIPDQVRAGVPEVADYTSLTNIGLYLVCVAAAEDLRFISHEKALDYLRQSLNSLQKMERHHGFHLNWYSIPAMDVTRRYVSSVDAAWLYASVAAIAVRYPELTKHCQDILTGVDFAWLFDPACGQFYLGYDLEKQEFSPYHYGLLCSESRILSYLGMAWNQIPDNHWNKLYRVLPDSVDQYGSPHYFSQQYGDYQNFSSGYYIYEDSLQILPSWNGSMFEYLMPTLFVDERHNTPMGLGENNTRIVAIHRDYALNNLGYQAWGMSPSATPEGGYAVFGVPEIGSQKEGARSDILTPHASILALSYAPGWVVDNLYEIENNFMIRGDYGFFDSVDPKTGAVAEKYLALDQGMILLSINNYLNSGSLPAIFKQIGEMDRVLELIALEQFFPVPVDRKIVE